MNWVKVTPRKSFPRPVTGVTGSAALFEQPAEEPKAQYVNLDQVQRIEPAPHGGTILWFDENHKLIVQETPAQLGLPVQQQRIQE